MMDKEFFEIANRLGACRLLHGTEKQRRAYAPSADAAGYGVLHEE